MQRKFKKQTIQFKHVVRKQSLYAKTTASVLNEAVHK